MPHASRTALLLGLLALPLPLGATARGQVCLGLVPLAIQPPTGQMFQVGCANVYTIKEAPPNGTTAGYGGIDFSQISPPCPSDPCAGLGTGASRFTCELANGWPCCMDSLQCVPAEQGNLSGPTKQAIEARFAADTDQREGLCYSDYRGNGSRLMTAPLTGPRQGSGSGCYIVDGFVSLFIKRIPGNGNQSFLTVEAIHVQTTPARRTAWGEVKLLYR